MEVLVGVIVKIFKYPYCLWIVNRKMVKKKVSFGKLEINFTNRSLYTLIAFFIVVTLGVGVYALGTTPNPGHSIAQIQPCDNGQILEAVSGSWACVTKPSSGGTSLWSEGETGTIYYDGGYVGLGGVTQAIATLDVDGSGRFTNNLGIEGILGVGGTESSYFMGDVGIGTVEPLYTLHLNGTNAGLKIQSDNNAEIWFDAGEKSGIISYHANGDMIIGADGNVTFSEGVDHVVLNDAWLSGDGGDEGIFVSSTGSVGIGTTTPENYKLKVNGALWVNDLAYVVGMLSADTVKVAAKGTAPSCGGTTVGSIYYNTNGEFYGCRYKSSAFSWVQLSN